MNRAEAAELLSADPGRTGIFIDFDGTISPIVDDPALARPVPGSVAVLHRLAQRFGRVAVISGRPVAFLLDRLEVGSRSSRLETVGLYGIERGHGNGRVELVPGAEEWRGIVEEAAEAAVCELDRIGIEVERKGLAVTYHWRRAPDRPVAERAAVALAERQVDALGLALQRGRMVVELTPPIAADKGVAVARLCEGMTAVLYAGDDLSDLPSFGALDALARSEGLSAVKVAVGGSDAPPAVASAADLVVEGPFALLALLSALDRAPGR